MAALVALAGASALLSASAQSNYPGYPGYNTAPGMEAPTAVGLPPNVNPSVPSAAPATPNMGSMDFWKSFVANRITPGSVLTGTLEDDLSSKKAKAGDIFAIVLNDGFTNQGKVVIPPGSRIIGTVTSATPAKGLKFGMPGNIDVSLQSLALPDGRTGPISGFIEHNPNHDIKDDPNKGTNNKSIPIGDYTNSAKAMGYSLVTRVTRIAGVRYSPHANQKAGKDFEMKKGEVLAVKLNRPLDLASLVYPAGSQNAAMPAPNAVQGNMQPFSPQSAPPFGAAPGSQAGLPQGEPF